MAGKRIQLFGLGFHSKSPNVTANRLTNAFYEITQEDERSKVTIYGTPGLVRVLNAGSSPWRGLLWIPGGSKYYGIAFNVFYEIDNVGNLTPRGTISTSSGRVGMATDGTQILVVDGTAGYGFDTSTPGTPIAEITDADFPANPKTCTFQGGRFIVDDSGTADFQGSDPYDVFTWPGLNIARAESSPDPIVRVQEHKGSVIMFKEQNTEFWQNIGGSGFPYARIQGINAPWGLASRWSLAPFMGGWAFLARNREGQVTPAVLQDFKAKSIGNFEFDAEINAYDDLASATGIGYLRGGHPFYQLNFPTTGKSWLYDGSTNYWSELSSGDSRHRADLGVEFLNNTLVADYDDGRIYRFDADTFTDDGDVLKMAVRGKHIIMEGNTWFRLDRLEMHCESGVGTVANTNPQAVLRLSKDGGHEFGTSLFAPLGNAGEYRKRTVWSRLGRARDVVPEISISAPVKRVLTSATLFITPGIS